MNSSLGQNAAAANKRPVYALFLLASGSAPNLDAGGWAMEI
jgi:hypothetical protein